ncbi:nickel-binding protein [Aurantimonas sp. A2-1-M11]|uniref:nickel-binding protein n=1 Tax=Aurantimonas sp. A2-1-M11 TaxID=3113712 RepID=UPI002F936F1A
MSIFMVERDLSGIDTTGLEDAQKAAIATAAQMREHGSQINYVRSIFSPDDGRCMCIFDADQEADVRHLNDRAGLPYHNIVPVLDLAT